eukprot:gnl/MRDRNA2_/MRDRNA2_552787_c0_seq1.p1 gnl/MRDRNA2_/MRDRNA2_552787_c0~~gnl/MRDRNA2_/MRDRNA2_552787_c0_seq1.p1  ORF type:complete len:143 (-),score=7.56 gnl/MRDRNA2_/MRDRNA2_552787_c0_seq1:28-456(-)
MYESQPSDPESALALSELSSKAESYSPKVCIVLSNAHSSSSLRMSAYLLSSCMPSGQFGVGSATTYKTISSDGLRLFRRSLETFPRLRSAESGVWEALRFGARISTQAMIGLRFSDAGRNRSRFHSSLHRQPLMQMRLAQLE